MEAQFQKLKEYLKMDTEIPFKEFEEYYQEIIDFLQKDYDDLEQADLIKARYIATIVASNALGRAKRKEAQVKRYRKMAEKCDFWAEAIKFRLLHEGMTEKELDEAEKALGEAV